MVPVPVPVPVWIAQKMEPESVSGPVPEKKSGFHETWSETCS
jgi:hypothetical protein